MRNNFTSRGLRDTRELARRLAPRLQAGDVVLFYGDLGAGKTFFIRELCASLGISGDEVTSPTFNILRMYAIPGRSARVCHFDFYRMHPGAEMDLFEIEDYLTEDSIALVEWADRLAGLRLPGRTVSVTMTIAGENEREISIEPWTP